MVTEFSVVLTSSVKAQLILRPIKCTMSQALFGQTSATQPPILTESTTSPQIVLMELKLMTPNTPKKENTGKTKDFKEELAQNLTSQMKYVLPVIIFFVAYTISAAIALYWAVSSLFSIAQERIIRNKLNVSAVETGANRKNEKIEN